jgi:hypothetical protein
MTRNLKALLIAGALNLPAGAALAQFSVDLSTNPYVVCGSVESFTATSESDGVPFEFQTEWYYVYPNDSFYKETEVSCCTYTFAGQSVGNVGQSGAVYTFYKLNPAEDDNPGKAPNQLWGEIADACPEHTQSGTITAGSTCNTTLTTISCSGSSARAAQEAQVDVIRSAVSSDPASPKLVPSWLILTKSQILQGFEFDASKLGQPIEPLSNADRILSESNCRKVSAFSRSFDTVSKSGAGVYECASGLVVVNESVRRVPASRQNALGPDLSYNYLMDDAGRRLSTVQRRFGDVHISVALYSDQDEASWLQSIAGQVRPR